MTKGMMPPPPPPPPPPPAPPAVTTTTTTILTLEDLAEMGIEEVKTAKYDGFVFKMSDDQYETFKKSIASIGLKKPITINQNGDVLDGHHRLKACQELNIPARFVVEPPFEHDVDERIYVREVNLRQRHLTQGQRVKQALALKPDYEEKARLNMSLGGKGMKVSRDQETFHTDERLSAIADTSKDTFYKAERLLEAEQENPEQFGKLATDYLKGNITANKAYRKIRKAEAHTKKKAELAQAAEKLIKLLPEKVTLLNLDSTGEVPEIPDDSVDLIITDPPYTAGKLPPIRSPGGLCRSQAQAGR